MEVRTIMDASKRFTVAEIESQEEHIELINGEKIIEDKPAVNIMLL